MMIRAAQTTMRYKRDLFKIAVAMGAILGLSYFIFTLNSLFLGGIFGMSGDFF